MPGLKWLMAGALALAASVAIAQPGDKLAPTLVPAPATKTAPPSKAPAPTPAPTPASGGHALEKADLDTWLDGYVPHALAAADIPGAVVVVVKDGAILTARGFGYADVAKRTPVDPERTLFRPGSVSKLFTWTAAMQMVEQGKLDLDADINRYLDFQIPAYDGKPVTLRQLMTHTGGFEEVGRGVVFYDPKYDMPLDRYLKRHVPARIFAPGTTPAYSNWATALTAYMVQRVSGEEFDAYLEHHIFAPLGMKNATFRQPLPANLAAQMATGYPQPGKAKPFELVGPAPAGSASVSGTDMGRFMIAHLQHGQYEGASILRPETADLMHNSPVDKVDPMSLIPPLNRMELGFFETNINGREVIGHLGDTSAFHTSLHLFLKEGVGFYVSFNSPGRMGAVGALRTAMFEDFADRYFPDATPAPVTARVDAKTAAEHARMMTGRWIASRRADSSFLSALYWLSTSEVISVGPKGGLVIPSLTNAGKRPRQWIEIAPFVWRDVGGHELVAAKVVNGKVVRWSLGLAAPFEMFDRVPAHLSAGWLKPGLVASIVVLLLTAVFWPTAWLVRRHFGAPAPVAGHALRAQRATRLMAALDGGLLIVYMLVVTALFSDGDASAAGGAVRLYALQIAALLIIPGAVLVSGWNLWLTWSDGRRWHRKLWSLVVFLAALLILYFGVVFHLFSFAIEF